MTYEYQGVAERVASYRPFCKAWLYFDSRLIHRLGKAKSIFPTPQHDNVGFYLVGVGSDKQFSALATWTIPDLAFWGSSNGQFFPRWTYEKVEDDAIPGTLASDEYGYRKIDNITDATLHSYQDRYGLGVTKDDVFYYVYGLLHSPEYRSRFAADLKKMLPRIPQVEAFAEYTAAGRALAELHIGYESVEPWPVTITIDGVPEIAGSPEAQVLAPEVFRVQKMAFAGVGRNADKSRIIYNPRVTISEIPAEAYDYVLGSRSAVEWLIDRYQVKTDKASGIVNDPNDWCTEHDDPRYIVDLVARVVRVSVESARIVTGLPPLGLDA